MHSAILATAASLATTASPAAMHCEAALSCPASESDTLPDGTLAAFGRDMAPVPASTGVNSKADRPRPNTRIDDGQLQSPDWPVASMRITSRYGRRADPFGGGIREHAGIDIAGSRGTPVHATAGGWIALAGAAGGYGQLVQIDHGNGIVTRYGHLERILVTLNSRVERGQLIAYMGSTGRSTGNHLHFEVRNQGRAVDPLRFLSSRYVFSPFKASGPTISTPIKPHVSAFAQGRSARGAAKGSGLDVPGEERER